MLAPFEKELRLSLATNTESSLTFVGQALLPDVVLDGKECQSYRSLLCQMPILVPSSCR